MTRKRTRENLVQMLCEPCGYCEGRGVNVIVTPNSPSLNADGAEDFYGYVIQPVIHREEHPKPTLVTEDKEQANG